MKSDYASVDDFSKLITGSVIERITVDDEGAHVDLKDGRTLIFLGFGDIAVTEMPRGNLQ